MIGGLHTVEIRQRSKVTLRLVVHDRLPLGRAGDGLVLIDERISRTHCEIRARGEELVVVDLGSSNGTFVNDDRVGADPVALRPGDVITLGNVSVLVDPEDTGEIDDPGVFETTIVASTGAAPSIDELRSSVVGGTITICFSDIVESTALNAEAGDKAWFAHLSRHQEILRGHLGRHGGTEVKGQGDGFMFTFPSARAALGYAIAAQRALAEERERDAAFPVHVRIGVHTGEVIRDSGDLFGWHVNLAARVAGEGHGDEILASQLVVDLTASMGDIEIGEPREVELKGFEGRHRVYPVAWQR